MVEIDFLLFILVNLFRLGTSQSGLLAEALLWEYVVQISSLIRTLHAASLSCRCLHLSRILVDGDSKSGRAKSR